MYKSLIQGSRTVSSGFQKVIERCGKDFAQGFTCPGVYKAFPTVAEIVCFEIPSMTATMGNIATESPVSAAPFWFHMILSQK